MADDAARAILVAGAGALARGDGLEPTLQVILDAVARPLEILSAAVVLVDPAGDRPRIVASFGIGPEAAAGLGRAIQDPAHPIRRTVAERVATYDVLPVAPGGPALRSHLPLTIALDGTDAVLGVIALAHDRPIDPSSRPLVQAAADLVAVAIERHPG